MRLLLLSAALGLILCACCPAVRTAPQTAFTATVTGVSAGTLEVRSARALTPVTVELTSRTALLGAKGERLEPGTLKTGMRIWVSGTLTSQTEVLAQEVQLLAR